MSEQQQRPVDMLAQEMADRLVTAKSELDAMRQRAEAAEAERDELRALIAYIDAIAPRADKTCDEPGITLSEAARRQMAEEAQAVQP